MSAENVVTVAPGPDVRLIAIEAIVPSPTNPRKRVDEQGLVLLAESIRKIGVLSPVLVRGCDGPGERFELVAGERRWRAARLAGLPVVPALVRVMSAAEVLEAQIVENLQREDVHPLEEAAGYQRLMKTAKLDVARIAERVGRSVKYIYDRVKLLQLIPEIQELFLESRITENRITAGHAILLARLSPHYQALAINTRNRGALWQEEHGELFNPTESWSTTEKAERDALKADPYHGFKARSVRELSAWIDRHCRFDPEAADTPDLFPETAAAVVKAREEAVKVVLISHDRFVQPAARTKKERIYCSSSWKRAEKACDHTVVGVVAAGYGRGQSFPVCVDKKKCKVHWGSEQRQASRKTKALAKGDSAALERMKKKEQDQADRQKRLLEQREKAMPALMAALVVAILNADPTAAGPLAGPLYMDKPNLKDPMQPGKTAEDLVRYLAWQGFMQDFGPHDWQFRGLTAQLKRLGLDPQKIVDQVAREEKVQTSAPEKKSAPATKKKAGKKAAKKGTVKR